MTAENSNMNTMIIVVLALLWLLDVDLEAQSTVLGTVLMLLAVIFYHIPRIAYRITQRRYKQLSGVNEQILKQDWPAFRRWLDSQV